MVKRTIMIGLALAAGFVVASGGAADSGGGFADFYRQHQSRLLTQFDGALAAKAAAVAENFIGVKKANVQLQTPLGGRRGNVGADIIGAFDESANHAVGWQVRGYVGEDSTTGANAGVFYRTIKGDGMLFGANVFADFEDSDYGNFTRFGVGGEVRHPRVRFDANYYAPLSGSKQVSPTLAAFSREGVDARLRLSVPNLQGVNAAVDYYNYNFDGRDDIKDDDGFRLGAEFVPWSDFRINLFYDNGDDKFGGDIVYAWTIGDSNRHSRAAGAGISPPDLFAPVSREHSQRIATVAVHPVSLSLDITFVSVSVRRTPVAPVTTTVTMIVPAVTGMTTTMTMTNAPPPRLASVRATTRHLFTTSSNPPVRNFLVETQTPYPVTLPAPGTNRPWVVNVSGPPGVSFTEGLGALTVFAIESNSTNPSQNETHCCGLLINSRTYSFTIVEGSEMLVPTTTVTTTMSMPSIPPMTNFVTMTTGMMTLTMSISIYATATTRITLTTSAMGELSADTFPFDDNGKGGNNSGNITNPPIIAATTPPPSFPPNYPSFLVDSAGISKPERRFPRLRRENDESMDSRLRGNDEIMRGNDKIVRGNDEIVRRNDEIVRGNDKIMRGNDESPQPNAIIPA